MSILGGLCAVVSSCEEHYSQCSDCLRHIPEGQGSLFHPVAAACTYTTKGSLMRPVVAAARKWAKSQVLIVLALDKAQGILAGANRLKALLVLVRKLRAQGTLITVLLIRATIERAWALRIGEIFVDVFSSVKIKSCHLLYTSILSMFLPTLVFFAKNISTNRGLN